MEKWQSPRSGAVYPVVWRLNVAALEIDLEGAAQLNDQEMVTTTTTGVTYWEGSVSATGSVAGGSVKAQGYMELTGYAESTGAPL